MMHFSRSSRKRFIAIIAAAVVLVSITISAAAGSFTLPDKDAANLILTATPTPRGAYTDTFHYPTQLIPNMFEPSNPCYGPAFVTVTYEGVRHITKNINGYHLEYSVHGTYTINPIFSSLTYTGRFNQSRGFNVSYVGSQQISQKIVTVVVSKGMLFHITFHDKLDANGVSSLTVENFSCAK